MAAINITLDTESLTPVNGVYKFTVQFLNAVNNQLLTDSKFPQNQEHTTSVVSPEYTFSVNIADGQYNIVNTKIRVLYKDKVRDFLLPPTTVDCATACTIFPIVSVTQNGNTTYNIVLSANASNTLAWKIINTSKVVVASGTANVTSTSFNITTPTLPNGNYLLELSGSTCKGKAIKAFTVANNLPPCDQGPILEAILAATPTSVQFRFNGIGVFGITWRIKQGSSIPRTGVIKHTSIAQQGDVTFSTPTPTVNFASLPNGSYTFEIEGSTCQSLAPSSLGFSINSGSETPLQFITGSPSATGSSGNYSISIAINKAGAYNTVILNTVTGTYHQNGNVTYVANTPYVKTGLPVGTYLIKVGTLETTLVIQNSGNTPCDRGPTLMAIQEARKTYLKFLFDGNAVTAITWRIKSGSSIVKSGVVYPTNNTPTVTYSEISDGTYTFEIEGNNCSSNVSSNSFTIAETPTGDNAGVLVTETSNKTIRVINGKDFTATVNSATGAIRLNYNELDVADQGGKQVKAWLLSGEQVEIKGADLTALRSSSGLILPEGNYHFYLYYAATDIATTFADLKTNMYVLFLNPATWPLNSKRLQEVIIEVRPKQLLI